MRSGEPQRPTLARLLFADLIRRSQMRIGFQQFASCSKRVSMNAGKTLVRRASALWRDNDGLMAPYVAGCCRCLSALRSSAWTPYELADTDASRRG